MKTNSEIINKHIVQENVGFFLVFPTLLDTLCIMATLEIQTKKEQLNEKT